MDKQVRLRRLPGVDQVLQQISKEQPLPQARLVTCVRDVLDRYRQAILDGKDKKIPSIEELATLAFDLAVLRSRFNLRRVINATGVVLHTNLGRAPLGEKAQKTLVELVSSYCNLELDLKNGKRGSRYFHVEQLLVELTGAEAALVVNNNAAAVLLALSTLASGKEVIVSRGQLVEIGGSFRIPEVMVQSGARLVEVGTTNKTYPADYEGAITSETALLLKVHTSNYRVQGFTKETSLSELVALGGRHQVPVMEDLGSGCLADLQALGIGDEATVRSCVRDGADVVTFSGDKLLGGPQAGIVIGKKEYLEQMKRNQLLRALRVDKMTVAALEATLREYLDEEGKWQQIPVLRFLTRPLSELEAGAKELAVALDDLRPAVHIDIISGYSQVGGGALPLTKLPTRLVGISSRSVSAQSLAEALRNEEPAVLVRVQNEQVIIDLRAVNEKEKPLLIKSLRRVLGEQGDVQ